MKLRPLTIVVLILLVVYVLADITGMANHFNDVVNQRNGSVKTTNGSYVKHVTIYKHYWHYSILNDPKATKFQLFRGAMKKSALERMTYIGDDVIRLQKDEPWDEIKDRLKLIAMNKNGNTIIINGESMQAEVQIKKGTE